MHKIDLINCLENDNLEEASFDIRILPEVIKIIDRADEKLHLKLLTLINTIILNPFDLSLILSKQEIYSLVEFNINSLAKDLLTEIASYNLAIILNNAFISRNELNYSENKIFNFDLGEIFFYAVMHKLSKLNKIKLEIKFKDDEPISIKIIKVKIITNQTLKGFLDLNYGINTIRNLLSHENSKLGWQVSESLLKLIKISNNPDEILYQLINRIEIQCSSYWINTTNLFSLLILNSFSVRYEFYKEMLFYWQEEIKTEIVRESALTYVQSLLKKNHIVDVNDIIFIYLFDKSVRLRTQAFSLLKEYFYNPELRLFIDECCLSNLTLDNKLHLIQKYTPMFPIKKYFILLLNHPCDKLRKFASKFIQKFVNCINDLPKREEIFFKSGILSFMLKEDFIIPNNKVYSEKCELLLGISDGYHFCKEEIDFLNGIIFDQNLYNSKLFTFMAENYLKVLYLFLYKLEDNLSSHLKNILFILDKNFVHPIIPFLFAKIYQLDFEYSKTLFNIFNRRTKESLILANTFNFTFIDSILKKYLLSINEFTLNSIYLILKHSYIKLEENLIKEIEKGLDNYEVDYAGDKGMKIRLNALKIINLLNNDLFTKYFIRYFVDKSKYIRDKLVISCAPNKEEFYFINELPIQLNTVKINDFLTHYYENYSLKRKNTLLGNDLMHFDCSFDAFFLLNDYLRKDFLIGLLTTLKNSDTTLKSFIFSRLVEIKVQILEIIKDLLSINNERKIIVITFSFVYDVIKKENDSLYKNELKHLIYAIQSYFNNEIINEMINKIY